MARSFRYYEKKRGKRRTGSPALGSVGEAVFWAVLLVLGCGGTVLLFLTVVVPEWRVNHEFVATTCKVLDKRVGESSSEDGPVYRPEFYIKYEVGVVTYGDWHYDIHRAYSGRRESSQAILDRFATYDPTKDNRYPCWYNPTNPDVVVLVREPRWWVWLVFTVPVSFIAIGAGGLIYKLLRWGKSAERRAAMVHRTQERDFFGSTSGSRLYPYVPQGIDMTNSPGTRLKFRLPMAASPGWVLFGMLAFCVVWNGVVWVLAWIDIHGFMAGHPDWFLLFLLIPLLLIGLGAILIFVRQVLVAAAIGPTLIEISDHPLLPGGQYRLFLSQSGRLKISAIRVLLVCEEAAVYSQGTNTRTETQTVHRQELFRREGLKIQSGVPFDAEIEFSVPVGAMHSFKTGHNEIRWALLVEGDVAGWPGCKRCFPRAFPVVVCPANGDVER